MAEPVADHLAGEAHTLAAHLGGVVGPLTPRAQALAHAARPLPLRKGQTLLSAGERWQHLWWVETGALRLYYLDRHGQAANKNFYLGGAMLWPITPDLAGEPVGFWVEALGDSRVWALPWPAWQAEMAQDARWQALERRVLAALLQDKMRREQLFLQASATQRYEALRREHPVWAEAIALRHLASYLGITDVALSRIRRRLRAAGA